jgi:hypothetical protein
MEGTGRPEQESALLATKYWRWGGEVGKNGLGTSNTTWGEENQ